jgi:hypothetical protein
VRTALGPPVRCAQAPVTTVCVPRDMFCMTNAPELNKYSSAFVNCLLCDCLRPYRAAVAQSI